MNSRIKQLPPLIANQIAAGEVIERPASVVKELLENSQDAGALNITLELGYAGLNQIKIIDDGGGICEEDLPLAIKQHATSKINCLNDLYNIQSMGFRGEALASISAVAKLSIISRTSAQQHAAKLEIKEDKILISSCPRSVGTTIEVLDLFYNAPVRKNFLRSQRTELQYIEDVIKRFALAAAHITLTVKHNSKELFKIPADNSVTEKSARVRKIFGAKFIDTAIAVDFTRQDMRISGLLGNLDYQRSQKDKQWIYLNNRMLRDKLLQHAIMQIYQEYLPAGRFPACLLYLDMPTDLVDVNVHPTKHEVRFKYPRDVHDFLVSTLNQALKVKINLPISKKPQFKAPLAESEAHNLEKMYVLNSKFAIFYSAFEPYLVDCGGVYQEYCKNILKETILPLSARPLLVPVKYVLKSNQHQDFVSLQQLLEKFGISFDFLDVSTIIIRTIPQAFPQLDLNLLLAKINSKTLKNQLQLANLIIECQVFDVKLVAEHEKTMLLEYIKQPEIFIKYAKHLSIAFCQELFASSKLDRPLAKSLAFEEDLLQSAHESA